MKLLVSFNKNPHGILWKIPIFTNLVTYGKILQNDGSGKLIVEPLDISGSLCSVLSNQVWLGKSISLLIGKFKKKRKDGKSMMGKRYISITEEEAKELYCKSERVYVSTNERSFWKIPASYEYGSHAPAEVLFHRSVPKYEGNVEFFKIA